MRKMIKRICLFLTMCTLLLGVCIPVGAENFQKTDQKSGYKMILQDDAELFYKTDKIEEAMHDMAKDYGNVGVFTTRDNRMSTSDYAKHLYKTHFGSQSGFVFVIDMRHRQIYIYADGKIYKTINRAMAHTITDNVYQYATDSDYDQCALQALTQALAALQNKKIASPMRRISAALLAMVLSLMVTFMLAKSFSVSDAVDKSTYLKNVTNVSELKILRKELIFRSFSPQSSDSGGAGGSGGGGGGGSSGGGGGHGF